MITDAHRTAVSYGSLAETCLYFDHVVPLAIFFDDIATAMPHVEKPQDLRSAPRVPREFLPELLPESVRTPAVLERLEETHEQGLRALERWMDDVVRTKQPDPPGLYFQGWLGETQELVQWLGLRECPVVAEPGFLPSELETGAEEPDFAVTMMSLNLVDASSLSWHHIRECRRDRTAQMKLRRLRLFFAQNYAGKTRQHIEDDLSVALNDYADTVKAWGFETRTQVATMLLTSKWVAGALGGSALALILHSPLTSLIAGASALAIELGQVSLEVVKRQHALRRLTTSSPISYLADLRAASLSRRKMLSRR